MEDAQPATAVPDASNEEYAAFLAAAAAREKEEQERLQQEAEAEVAKKSRSTAYQRALNYIKGRLDAGTAFHNVMAKLVDSGKSMLNVSGALGGFSGTLRDYQQAGVEWLAQKSLTGESCILADEMGLGKTIQVIGLIAWMRANNANGPTLIVGPLSVVGNWVAEIQRFMPDYPVLRYTGSRETREALRQASIPREAYRMNSFEASVQAMPIFVTSYNFAVNDAEELARVKWRLLVVDEGHKLKSEHSVIRAVLQTYENKFIAPSAGAAAKKKKGAKAAAGGGGGGASSQADLMEELRAAGGSPQMRIILTGTPVQNDLMELWSLCNFVMPGIFASADDFRLVYKFMYLETRSGKDAVAAEEQRNEIISDLHKLLSLYMLRRTKDEVRLSLPPKVEAIVYTPLSAVQLRMLKAIEAETLNEEVSRMGWLVQRSSGGSSAIGSGGVISTSNKDMLIREVCCHPFLLACPYQPGQSIDDRIVTSCGKMAVLDKVLRKLRAGGHKVLIFSQFTGVLDELADYFEWRKEQLGEYRLLSGAVPAEERDQGIRDFNNDPDNKVFAYLLSTRAGGLGINLTAADTVIFYDSDWNPKMDAQAQDRAHRIGQTRPVLVLRLCTEGASYERRILRKAATKAGLGRLVLQEGRARLGALLASSVGSEAAAAAAAATVGSSGDVVEEDAEEGPVSPTSPLASGVSTRLGVVDENLIRFWLREDVECDYLQHGGIPDEELDVILDRARALQAGQRVAERVESELAAAALRKAGIEPPPVAAAAAGSSSSSAKTAASSSSSMTWEQLAAAAPFTPSKGRGYEFVYHAASHGLMGLVPPPSSTGGGAVAGGSAGSAASAAHGDAAAASSSSSSGGCGATPSRRARSAAPSAAPTPTVALTGTKVKRQAAVVVLDDDEEEAVAAASTGAAAAAAAQPPSAKRRREGASPARS